MSIFTALRTATTGLSAAERSLAVTSNNIANVNTPGYSRKVPNQSTLVIEGEGVGVKADATKRIVDPFLNQELRESSSDFERAQALSDVLNDAQSRIFGQPGEEDRGLSAVLNRTAEALEGLANNPQNSASRSEVTGAVEDMLDQISQDQDTIQQLRRGIDQEIGSIVQSVNADIKALSELNGQFSRAIPNQELLDQRDAILSRLSANMEISTFKHDNETIAVYTASGISLLEFSPSTITYEPSPNVAKGSVFGAIEVFPQSEIDPATGQPNVGAVGVELVSSGIRSDLPVELANDATPDDEQLITSPLTTGKLKGLLEARDLYLPQMADQLGELEEMISFNFNKAHNNAVPYPPPATLNGTNTDLSGFDTAAAAGQATGEAYVAVVDADGSTILADITLDLSTAADSAAVVADLNAQLGGLGTAAINAQGALDITLADDTQGIAISEGTSSIQFTDPVTGRDRDYGFSHFFGLNDLVVADETSGTGLTVREDIKADNALLSRSVLSRETGVPVLGGTGDTRGSRELASALTENFATLDRGSLPGRASHNPVDYVADLIGHQAIAASQAERSAEASEALYNELTNRQASVSGVNLDEELSNLIIYQRAYSVSARVVTVTNEMMEELINMAR